LLELIRVYGVFATGGTLFDPIFISKITDSNGSLVTEATFKPTPVISAETAYLVTSILKSVIERGTGKAALELGRPAAGKTGTTNDYGDAWFIGYTPEMLAGVWVGFDEKRPLGAGETGGKVAAPIWTDFMKEALADQPVNDFHMPDEITFAHINPATGKRATATSSRAILEIFARGTEPQLPQPAPDMAIADANSPSPIGTEAPRPIREPAVVVAPPTPEVRTPLDELVDRQVPAAQQSEPLTEELLDPDVIPAPDDTVDTTETTDTIVPEANADVGASVVDPSPTEDPNNSAEPLQEKN
jgi:membrane peptidoglycan carboxypeptidase